MQQLTPTEEQLMEYLWTLQKAFMKELLDCYPEPKPAPTTVATLLRRMADKQFVAYVELGNARQYYPLVAKSDYFSRHLNGLIRNFFGNSTARFASFFTRETQMTTAELEELRQLIDQEIQKKKP